MARSTQRDWCTVTLQEVGGALGVPPGRERSVVEHFGISVTEDWAGRPAIAVEQAAEFASAYRRDRDAMREKNEAYQRYLADCARKAQAEQVEAVQRAREESRRKNRRLAEAEQELMAQRAAEQAAERHAEDQATRGNPVSFEDFEA